MGGAVLSASDARVWSILRDECPERWDMIEVFRLGVQEVLKQEEASRIPSVRVSDAVEQYLASKEGSAGYLRTLSIFLRQFSKSFCLDVKDVTADDVQAWLDADKRSTKTVQMVSGYIKTFLQWCEAQGWRESGALDWKVEKYVPDEVTIYSVDEMREILRLWPKDSLACVVIQAFAGLRSSEVARLDWQDVRESGIVVRAVHSKTKRRRIAPMLPVLKQWLEFIGWPEKGPVCPVDDSSVGTYYRKIADKVGVQWKKNGLRHSWCSYRLAATGQAARTALEAGHTVTIQSGNYDAVVASEAGRRWFEIAPPEGRAGK